MNRLERIGDPEESLRAALQGHQSEMWTAGPAIIQSFDEDKLTCTAQPAIQGRIRKPDGTQQWVNMPLLVDVPVQFPSGGGFTLTFPVKKGDEALIVFASRCIDAWWQSGGIQQQAEIRMHDLSDGFALVGIRSLPRALPGVSTNSTQLRSDDGETFVEVANGEVSVIAPRKITLTAPIIALNGNLVQTSHAGGTSTMQGPVQVAGDVTAGGKSMINHIHSGVQSGGSNTGKPV